MDKMMRARAQAGSARPARRAQLGALADLTQANVAKLFFASVRRLRSPGRARAW